MYLHSIIIILQHYNNPAYAAANKNSNNTTIPSIRMHTSLHCYSNSISYQSPIWILLFSIRSPCVARCYLLTLRRPNLPHNKFSDIINFIFWIIFLCVSASDLHLRFKWHWFSYSFPKNEFLSGTTHLAKKGLPIHIYSLSLHSYHLQGWFISPSYSYQR
jgi:hypothetical protein